MTLRIWLLFVSFQVIWASYDQESQIFDRSHERNLIWKGYDAKYSVPWIVSLRTVSSKGVQFHFCGGTLISENYVLTAAHCMIHNETKTTIIAVIGALNFTEGYMNEGNETRQVVKQIKHPKYNLAKEYDYDAGLMELASPVTTIDPVVLNFEGDIDWYEDSKRNGRYFGWGEIDTVSDRPLFLQEAVVPVKSPLLCSNLYKSFWNGRSMLCSGYLTPNSNEFPEICSGDSGGPLLVHGRQVGIISFIGHQSGCGANVHGIYDVMAKVSAMKGFINLYLIGPTESPSNLPTEMPTTASPTLSPSLLPSNSPSNAPTNLCDEFMGNKKRCKKQKNICYWFEKSCVPFQCGLITSSKSCNSKKLRGVCAWNDGSCGDFSCSLFDGKRRKCTGFRVKKSVICSFDEDNKTCNMIQCSEFNGTKRACNKVQHCQYETQDKLCIDK